MSLEKIDPKTIEFNKRLQIYRAIPQGFVESDIFHFSEPNEPPRYMARTGNGGTFVTNDLLQGLGYGRDWDSLMGSKVSFPFTEYVALFGINVQPYLGRLYRDISGNEGIVIRGPIALKDIEVLFCADRNILDKLDLDSVLLASRQSKGNAREIFQRKREDLLQMAGEPPNNTLVSRYHQSSETLVEQIHTYLKRFKPGTHTNLTKKDITELLPQIFSMFGPLPHI